MSELKRGHSEALTRSAHLPGDRLNPPPETCPIFHQAKIKHNWMQFNFIYLYIRKLGNETKRKSGPGSPLAGKKKKKGGGKKIRRNAA